MKLEVLLLGRSGAFSLFICFGGQLFRCIFRPFPRGGNFGPPGALSIYSSSYGNIFLEYVGLRLFGVMEFNLVR